MGGTAGIPAAGFVLAGGRSTRMGSDKALLWINGRTLLEHTARNVRNAVGNVTVVADPRKYAHLGLPAVPDRYPDCGPLGGIVTALELSKERWNLVVACDMPDADTQFLKELVNAAGLQTESCECLAPVGPRGVEPLCALYHRDALPKLREALRQNIFKMRIAADSLNTRLFAVSGSDKFRNINTPADWVAHE